MCLRMQISCQAASMHSLATGDTCVEPNQAYATGPVAGCTVHFDGKACIGVPLPST